MALNANLHDVVKY